MREPGQSAGDTLLASWRTSRSRQQRFRAPPIVPTVESGRVTSGVGANRVAAVCTCAFALAEVAGKNTNSTRTPAAVSPGPRAPAGQRGCRLLRRLAVRWLAGSHRRTDYRLRGVRVGASKALPPHAQLQSAGAHSPLDPGS